MPTFTELFKEHALAPFFLFQIFSVILWCFDDYPQYGIMTLVMLVVSEAAVVKSRLFNMSYLRSMVDKHIPDVYVYRLRRWQRIPAATLLPGDIVSLTTSSDEPATVPADIVVLAGQAVVNEAMLNGESTPRIKESVSTLGTPSDVLDIDKHKNHLLFAGTQLILHTPDKANARRCPDNGVIGYVYRTGFATSQGRLMRSIIYAAERITVNSNEAFYFIAFLLVFAVASAGYVLYTCWNDTSRTRAKLLIYCANLLTSIVPIELPMELSLAVNASLTALKEFGIFCTESFRVPIAGGVDVCCFDKTGTLTSDKINMKGVLLCGSEQNNAPTANESKDARTAHAKGAVLVEAAECPAEATYVIAGCHSLVALRSGGNNGNNNSSSNNNNNKKRHQAESSNGKEKKGKLVYHGDPVEVAGIKAIDFHSEGDSQVIVAGKKNSRFRDTRVTIMQRFPFSSALMRMSTIISVKASGKNEQYKVVAKGAPEVIKRFLVTVPAGYDEAYLEYTRRGARVLAMASRDLEEMPVDQLRKMTRDETEQRLTFCGFSVFECPVKSDSKETVRALRDSAHNVTMITGDNTLTACYVAKKLGIVTKKLLCIRQSEADGELSWQVEEGDTSAEPPAVPLPSWGKPLTSAQAKYFEFCVDGKHAQQFFSTPHAVLDQLLNLTKVYSRVKPEDKETVLALLKDHRHITMMCGDGTNDVGALKQAHIGIALLNVDPKKSLPPPPPPQMPSLFGPNGLLQQQQQRMLAQQRQQQQQQQQQPQQAQYRQQHSHNGISQQPREQQRQNLFNIQNEMFKQLADQENTIKLGDASIASPFTCKSISVKPILNILRQGRCTLVTTHQMYKILAANSLINAYSMSVLYIAGVKMSDSQALVLGILIACCFLFISRSKPAEKLSKKRPLANLLHPFMFLSILAQFAVNFVCLYLGFEWTRSVPGSYLAPAGTAEADAHTAFNGTVPADGNFAYLDAEFSPNLVNTIVFLVCRTQMTHRCTPFFFPSLFIILLSIFCFFVFSYFFD